MDIRFILIGIALLSILVILGIGVFSMLKGGEFNKKYGNKLMIARVVAQAIAVLLFAALFIIG